MVRKKITFAYINKESERKASFKKRNKGFMKKMEELSTLCGVDACSIIYSEFQPHPEVWPSPMEAWHVLERFMDRPEMGKSRFMHNQMSFTQQRIERAKNKLHDLYIENKQKQLTIFMFQCIEGNVKMGDFDVQDTDEMNIVINDVLREITERIEKMRTSGEGPSSGSAMGEEVLRSGADHEGSSYATMALMRTAEAAAKPGFLVENENPPGFSYWNMLMSPIDGVADFGWNNEASIFPPEIPDSITPGLSRPRSD